MRVVSFSCVLLAQWDCRGDSRNFEVSRAAGSHRSQRTCSWVTRFEGAVQTFLCAEPCFVAHSLVAGKRVPGQGAFRKLCRTCCTCLHSLYLPHWNRKLLWEKPHDKEVGCWQTPAFALSTVIQPCWMTPDSSNKLFVFTHHHLESVSFVLHSENVWA